jgi:CheY-like chemotaxis protein
MAIAGWRLAIAVGVGPMVLLVLDALQSFIPVDWNEPLANRPAANKLSAGIYGMKKILVVEDNEMNRDMLCRRLARKGFSVLIAADGVQGLNVARDEAPDVILMDLSLPRINGWEACRRLKADQSTSSIPVIALTAHAMSTDRDKALAAGCDDFDTKPVDFVRLLDKIERACAGT